MNVSASYELRVFLQSIAQQLKETESATGRRVKRPTADGYELEWVPDPPDKNGLSKVSFINVRVEQWRELGTILERVANGEDARKLFGQDKRTKPSKIGEHRLRALAYWSVRAKAPAASDGAAIELARRIVTSQARLTAATIRKYAQRHRQRCLALLSGYPNWVLHFEHSDIQIRLPGPAIVPLLRYLRKKGSLEDYLKTPQFERPSDVLFYTPKRDDDRPGIRSPAFPGMSMHME